MKYNAKKGIHFIHTISIKTKTIISITEQEKRRK